MIAFSSPFIEKVLERLSLIYLAASPIEGNLCNTSPCGDNCNTFLDRTSLILLFLFSVVRLLYSEKFLLRALFLSFSLVSLVNSLFLAILLSFSLVSLEIILALHFLENSSDRWYPLLECPP